MKTKMLKILGVDKGHQFKTTFIEKNFYPLKIFYFSRILKFNN